MLTLLIDNYDSFTWNLFQLLAEENGVEPIVVRNDEASWEQLARLGCDNVVISPGPGRPERERDFGVCAEAIRRCEVPLLGVCLGHQGLGWVHGGAVEAAPQPLHGRVRTVEHAGTALFAGIPNRFEATRYHSLCLARPLPPELEEIAWSDDGVVMAVAHRSRPQWGVQFHPESIATEHGRRLLANFRDLTAAQQSRGSLSTPQVHKEPRVGGQGSGRLILCTQRLDAAPGAEAVFAALFTDSRSAFWLDSARPGAGARFSFIGDASGPLGATVTYDVGAKEVRVERGGEVETLGESIFDYLERETARLPPAPDLPFEFACGFAGYLGYELKAECGANAAHASPHPDAALVFADRMLAFDHQEGHVYLLCLHEEAAEGDAVDAGADADRQRDAHDRANAPTSLAADEWLADTATRLAALSEGASVGVAGEGSTEPPRCCSGEPSPDAPHWTRPHAQYLDAIAECKQLLQAGESYEICLTNELAIKLADPNPLSIYRGLRRVNPAPFASYLRCGDLAVLSSSPERFLRIDREGGVEAKPIKGTAPRGSTAEEDARLREGLRASEKDRAENLMIVDLLRNDLGSVCAVGSVEVPALMAVESYETVHQLVSTVRGRLRPDASTLDCVRACFPPGSMTGAPKLRTLEILDRLEGRPRGVYSGAIGWFGAAGAGDLSVTIRTIVLDRAGAEGKGEGGSGWRATVGAGGAIVLDSDPEREYGEMLLKAAAPLRALGLGLDPASDAGFGPAPISLAVPRRAAPQPLPASAHDLKS
jgi:para-aminobenzoate synthetase